MHSGEQARMKADVLEGESVVVPAGTDVIFEGRGPGAGQCSVLVGPIGQRTRYIVQQVDVEPVTKKEGEGEQDGDS